MSLLTGFTLSRIAVGARTVNPILSMRNSVRMT